MVEYVAKKRTIRAEIDGQVFTRKTDRIYSHVIVGWSYKESGWVALAWVGREELVAGKIRAFSNGRNGLPGYGDQVRAIPVLSPSPVEACVPCPIDVDAYYRDMDRFAAMGMDPETSPCDYCLRPEECQCEVPIMQERK